MAQFNFEKAIQCIPEFHGNTDDVQNFFEIANIFHERIGAKEKDYFKQFLAVIRVKLKDDARERESRGYHVRLLEVQDILNSIK